MPGAVGKAWGEGRESSPTRQAVPTAGDGDKDGAEPPHCASVSPGMSWEEGGMAAGDPGGAEPPISVNFVGSGLSHHWQSTQNKFAGSQPHSPFGSPPFLTPQGVLHCDRDSAVTVPPSFYSSGDEEKPLWEQVQGFSLPHPTGCCCEPQITGVG